MAHVRRGEKAEAERLFKDGVERFGKDPANGREVRMFWGAAAAVLDKPGPVPTLLEAQAQPKQAIEALKRAAAEGHLKLETMQNSLGLVPLRARPDFQAQMRSLRMGTVH